MSLCTLYSVFVVGNCPKLLVHDQLSPFEMIIDSSPSHDDGILATTSHFSAFHWTHFTRKQGRLQLQNVQQPCPKAGYFDTSPNLYRVLVLEYETSTRDIQMSIDLPDTDILS